MASELVKSYAFRTNSAPAILPTVPKNKTVAKIENVQQFISAFDNHDGEYDVAAMDAYYIEINAGNAAQEATFKLQLVEFYKADAQFGDVDALKHLVALAKNLPEPQRLETLEFAASVKYVPAMLALVKEQKEQENVLKWAAIALATDRQKAEKSLQDIAGINDLIQDARDSAYNQACEQYKTAYEYSHEKKVAFQTLLELAEDGHEKAMGKVASIYHERGELNNCKQWAKKLATLDGIKGANGLRNLGIMYANRGKLLKAFVLFQQAYEKCPPDQLEEFRPQLLPCFQGLVPLLENGPFETQAAASHIKKCYLS